MFVYINIQKIMSCTQIEDPSEDKALKIGIIGGGFVGSATKLLECSGICTVVWDTDPEKRYPDTVKYTDLLSSDFIFICVPTPMTSSGECHTGIVERVVSELKQHNYPGRIVVRSTVPVGFCERHSVDFMPEFLTEAHWKYDFYSCNNWIIGTDNFNADFHTRITELFTLAKKHGCVKNSTIQFVGTKEAEAAKYFRNCFLATKVSFCNEIYRFCNSLGVDYNQVAELGALDPRIGSSHTSVPGPDGKTGFSGSCFPKDMASLEYQMKSKNVSSKVISACISRNTNIDRPECDWANDELKGRATI